MSEDITHYFNDLKKTMEGKDDYYFLVNDSNNEIRQHYDDNYELNFDKDKFIQSITSKKSYFKSKDMNYNFFVIPDKSITMRDHLPFKTNEPRRIVDMIEGYVYDINPLLNKYDILKNDTHITYMSSLKIVSYILSTVNGCSIKEVYQQLDDKLDVELIDHKGDLFFDMNWSYPKDERFLNNAHIPVERYVPKDDYTLVDSEDIPEEFRYVSRRKSLYYKNPNSISDRRALIIRDSSTDKLINTFIAYYREVFFYWDHWYFNKRLVEYLNPDDVIEIRTERFLNNPHYPTLENGMFVKQKVLYNINEFYCNDGKLSIDISMTDYTRLPFNTNAKVYLDDSFLGDCVVLNGLLNYAKDLSDNSPGLYQLKVVINESDRTIETVIDKTINVSENIYKYFNNLKRTLKGKDEIFFLVNDADNEIVQHYDLEYKSPLNLHDFKSSIKSRNNYLEKRSIKTSQFIIPDKSVIMRDYLPFKTPSPVRHLDKLRNFYYDLSDVLTEDDYYANDTKISMESSLKVVSYIIHKTFKEDTYDNILELLKQRTYIKSELFDGDLFTDDSWSYDKDELYEKYAYTQVNKVFLNDEDNIIKRDIPDEFKEFNSSKSHYYENHNAILNKCVLILADKSIYPLINPLKASFRQLFIYYDEWYFNKDLVDYLNPDTLIEIKAERLLDNPLSKQVSEKSNILIPVKIDVKSLDADEDKLNVGLYCEDLRGMPIDSSCKFYIDDDVLIREEKLDRGCCNTTLDLGNLSKGMHVLKIRLEESEYTKAKLISRDFEY